jgi:hypothetical protein
VVVVIFEGKKEVEVIEKKKKKKELFKIIKKVKYYRLNEGI